MQHKLQFTEGAAQDAEAYREYILSQSNDDVAADTWVSGLLVAADSLKQLPQRCALIPEHKSFRFELRSLLYSSHRIIFRIDGNTVHVLRIYHAAARPLRSLRQRPSPPKK
ncbi:MAG: type II toxin-antitoxin system RelE/ParE family toxin [Acidobacteriaceae bacterium]|nr:type II toxin-antitoxin system RelE/ParE family toxin [Acidobacteriaceae bacterium]